MIEHVTINDLRDALGELGTPLRVNVVPYARVLNTATNKYEYYAFLEQSITGIISPFTTTVSYENTPSIVIADTIANSTFDLLRPRSDYMDAYLRMASDSEIDDRFTPIVLVELDIDTVAEVHSRISFFAEYVRQQITKNKSSSHYTANLVYLSSSDLFFLVRGMEYPIVDSKGRTNLYEVKKGVFFEGPVLAAYAPKSGDVPVQKIPTSNANSPFESVVFSDATPDFKEFMYSVLLEDERSNFVQPFADN